MMEVEIKSIDKKDGMAILEPIDKIYKDSYVIFSKNEKGVVITTDKDKAEVVILENNLKLSKMDTTAKCRVLLKKLETPKG